VTSSSSNTNFPYSVSPVTSGVQYKIISTDWINIQNNWDN
jgi:hypothetical protein